MSHIILFLHKVMGVSQMFESVIGVAHALRDGRGLLGMIC